MFLIMNTQMTLICMVMIPRLQLLTQDNRVTGVVIPSVEYQLDNKVLLAMQTNFDMPTEDNSGIKIMRGWQVRDSDHFDQRISKPIWPPAG